MNIPSTLVSLKPYFTVRCEFERGFGSKRIALAVSKAWPHLRKRFPIKLPKVTISDVEAALGGGPMGPFKIGIFSSPSIDRETAQYIEQVTGWAPQINTRDYINANYAAFEDPIQSYIDDMVTHELGHLFLGWGLTSVKAFTNSDAWFALGLGTLYDRLAWNEISTRASPLFERVESLWTNHFSKISDSDLRLIDPNESKDGLYNLSRIQTYAHGKSAIYLRALRNSIGEEIFDKIILQYISREIGSIIIYDEFISGFETQTQTKIRKLETEFVVR